MKDTLGRSLSQIHGYRELCDIIEEMRKEKYDPQNKYHEKRYDFNGCKRIIAFSYGCVSFSGY